MFNFCCNQLNDVLIELPQFPPNTRGVLWENWPMDKVSKIYNICEHEMLSLRRDAKAWRCIESQWLMAV